MELFELFVQILPGLASAAVLGLCGYIFKKARAFHAQHQELMAIREEFDDFRVQHAALMESQRNQIKNTIVHVYLIAEERGYVTAMELDCANRLTDSYFALDGNSYIKTIIRHLNEMPIRGEIPAHEE